MNIRFSPALLAILLATPAFAQRDAAPVDPNALLIALKKIEQTNQRTTEERIKQVIKDFTAAGQLNSKAIDLYEDAMRATLFAGQSQQTLAFQEWRKKEEGKLKSQEMQTAARLNLMYLAVSLKAATGVPREELIPELMQYCNELQEALTDKPEFVQGLLRQDLLKRNIAESPFAKWQLLGPTLQGLKNWEMMPDKLDGIYEKSILPVWREKKDTAQILKYWDTRLAREEKAVVDAKGDFGIEQFQLMTRPSLIWKRSEDLILLGMPNAAMTEMFNVIKATPHHPSNAAWIKQLQALCTPKEAAKEAPTTEEK